MVYFLILFLYFFFPPSFNFLSLFFSGFLRVGFVGEGVFFNVLDGDFGDFGDFGDGEGDFCNGDGDGNFGESDFSFKNSL